MLRTYLLALLAITSVIGYDKYSERRTGKGLLARAGIEGRNSPSDRDLTERLKTKVGGWLIADDHQAVSFGSND